MANEQTLWNSPRTTLWNTKSYLIFTGCHRIKTNKSTASFERKKKRKKKSLASFFLREMLEVSIRQLISDTLNSSFKAWTYYVTIVESSQVNSFFVAIHESWLKSFSMAWTAPYTHTSNRIPLDFVKSSIEHLFRSAKMLSLRSAYKRSRKSNCFHHSHTSTVDCLPRLKVFE